MNEEKRVAPARPPPPKGTLRPPPPPVPPPRITKAHIEEEETEHPPDPGAPEPAPAYTPPANSIVFISRSASSTSASAVHILDPHPAFASIVTKSPSPGAPPGIYLLSNAPQSQSQQQSSSLQSPPPRLQPPHKNTEGGVKAVSILAQVIRRMLLCCCWPVHKSAVVLSLFDTVVVGALTYNALKNLAAGRLDFITVALSLFFVAFFICQLIATVTLHQARPKGRPDYCWPRLVLIGGLLICAVIACIVMSIYFSGQTTQMNNVVFNILQFFLGQKISKSERKEMEKELVTYAVVFFVVVCCFALYFFFEFLLTRKAYREISEFHPVSTHEPSAPPAYNPDFQKA